MQIQYHSKVKREQFFQVIEDFIIADINAHSTTPITKLKKGLRFTKKTMGGQPTLCQIKDYEVNQLLSIEYKNNQIRSLLTYCLSSEEKGTIIDCTSQNFSLGGKELLPSEREKLVSEKQFQKRLRYIEKFIIKNSK